MEVERNTHPLLPGMDHYKPKAGSVSKVPQRDMLQQAMKQGSKDLHDQAENAAFIHKIINGGITRTSYRLFLADLYYIYTALEEEIERNKDHPVLGTIYFPVEISRKTALERDLAFFFGSNWHDKIRCTFAARKYVDRIRYLGAHDPVALVAHCYGRYLGDLSGGQIIRYRLAKNLELHSEQGKNKACDGLRFYDFKNIHNLKHFKDFYSGRLNALDLDENTFQKLVEETRVVFQLNIDLFSELDIIAHIISNSSENKSLGSKPLSKQDTAYLPSTSSVVQSFEMAWMVSMYILCMATLLYLAKMFL